MDGAAKSNRKAYRIYVQAKVVLQKVSGGVRKQRGTRSNSGKVRADYWNFFNTIKPQSRGTEANTKPSSFRVRGQKGRSRKKK